MWFEEVDWSSPLCMRALETESERAALRGLVSIARYGLARQVIAWLEPQLETASVKLKALEKERSSADRDWRQAKAEAERLLERYQQTLRMGARDERRTAEHQYIEADGVVSEAAERAETLSARLRERRLWVVGVESQLSALRAVPVPTADVVPGLADVLALAGDD